MTTFMEVAMAGCRKSGLRDGAGCCAGGSAAVCGAKCGGVVLPADSPEQMRCARLARIKAEIEDGSYSVSSRDVAEALMHHMLAS